MKVGRPRLGRKKKGNAVGLRWSPRTMRRLEKISKRDHVPITEIIRLAVEDFLKRCPKIKMHIVPVVRFRA